MERAKLNIKRGVQAIAIVTIWIVTAAIAVVFIGKGAAHRANLKVDKILITIADSTSNGNLITTPMIQELLAIEKIKAEGELASIIPLSRIEKSIERNGFVDKADAYINYLGELHIEIHQRSAAVRLLLDGYNCYISSNGYVFNAPPTTALYTPVVTGSYQPLFPSNYIGSIDDYATAEIDKLGLEIERIEREKYPIYKREKENNESKREIRRRYINRSVFESRSDFDQRVATLRKNNQKAREHYAHIQHVIDTELEAINRRQDAIRERQKKLQKYCDDIHNLITFVEIIERDEFWRSEVVQIMLTEGVDNQIHISMAVRSGNFRITFGTLLSRQEYYHESEIADIATSSIRATLPSVTTSKRMREEVAKKERQRQDELLHESIYNRLERLNEFYKEALPRVGWDRYKEINIEFKNQVVCKVR